MVLKFKETDRLYVEMVGRQKGAEIKPRAETKRVEGSEASRCRSPAVPAVGWTRQQDPGSDIPDTLFWELQLRLGVRGWTESGGRALPGSGLDPVPLIPHQEGQVSPLLF